MSKDSKRKEILSYGTMAALLFSAKKDDNIYTLSKKISEIKKKVEIPIYPTIIAGGHYSESLKVYQEAINLAKGTRRNIALLGDPISLSENEKKICKEVIENSFNESPAEMKEIAKILGLDLKQICS